MAATVAVWSASKQRSASKRRLLNGFCRRRIAYQGRSAFLRWSLFPHARARFLEDFGKIPALEYRMHKKLVLLYTLHSPECIVEKLKDPARVSVHARTAHCFASRQQS